MLMEPEMSEAGTDRILKLPRDVRQQILSLLCPKEAIATSVLSRSWRYAWLDLVHLKLAPDFYPRKDKDGYWYQKSCRSTDAFKDDMLRFLEFLDQALIKRKSVHSDIIRKITLYITLFDQLNSKLGSCLDKLKDQELLLHINTYDHYEPFDNNVPWFVFTTQSITKLSINRGCSVTGAYEINLPFLRELSLWGLKIDDLMVGKLIAGCTAIECLELFHCYGFKLLNVSGLSRLKKFKQYTSRGLERVEINAPKLCHIDFIERNSETSELVLVGVRALTSLELCCWKASIEHWISSNIQQQLPHLKNFEIYGCNVLEYIRVLTSSKLETLRIEKCENLDRFWICDCDKLTQLWLSICDITDHWLNMLLRSELANLEVMKVEKCDQLEHIKIFHTRLHTFNLEGCEKLDQVTIDCPKLSNFSYCPLGHKISSLSFESTGLLTSTTVDLWHTVLWEKDSAWYVELLGLLAKLRPSKYLSFDIRYIKDVKIPQELRQSHCPPLCEVDHLEVTMRNANKPEPVAEIMDALLWLYPRPKSLHVKQSNNKSMNIFIKFTYKKPRELIVMNCGCYSSDLPLNCWRHSVEDFKIIIAQGSLVAESLREFLESAITSEK